MTGQGSSRQVACARKCSVKHMVRACSTNQHVLRLSIGSLVLITATCWAPGCPSELFGQGGGGTLWVGWGSNQWKKESKKRATKDISSVCVCNEMRVKTKFGVRKGRRMKHGHRHKKENRKEDVVTTSLFFCCQMIFKKGFYRFQIVIRWERYHSLFMRLFSQDGFWLNKKGIFCPYIVYVWF